MATPPAFTAAASWHLPAMPFKALPGQGPWRQRGPLLHAHHYLTLASRTAPRLAAVFHLSIPPWREGGGYSYTLHHCHCSLHTCTHTSHLLPAAHCLASTLLSAHAYHHCGPLHPLLAIYQYHHLFAPYTHAWRTSPRICALYRAPLAHLAHTGPLSRCTLWKGLQNFGLRTAFTSTRHLRGLPAPVGVWVQEHPTTKAHRTFASVWFRFCRNITQATHPRSYLRSQNLICLLYSSSSSSKHAQHSSFLTHVILTPHTYMHPPSLYILSRLPHGTSPSCGAAALCTASLHADSSRITAFSTSAHFLDLAFLTSQAFAYTIPLLAPVGTCWNLAPPCLLILHCPKNRCLPTTQPALPCCPTSKHFLGEEGTVAGRAGCHLGVPACARAGWAVDGRLGGLTIWAGLAGHGLLLRHCSWLAWRQRLFETAGSELQWRKPLRDSMDGTEQHSSFRKISSLTSLCPA